MPAKISTMSSASKYNRIAPIYELIDLPLEIFFFRKWRKEALSDLSGKVLEIGVGSGRNLKYYPSNALVTGIDASEGMLEKAREKAGGNEKCQSSPHGCRASRISG